jgi:hypothetical protein
MTSIEDQVRLYAGAITEQRSPLPEPDRSRVPAPRHHRGAFVLAAAVLVAVVIGVAAFAVRSDGGREPATTTTTSEGQIVTELSLSTDAPTPGETVTAKVTITNDGSVPVTIRSSCSGHVTLTPGTSPSVGGVPGQTMFESDVQVEMALGRFVTDPLPALTLDRLQRLVGSDAAQATAELVGCDDDTVTIDPGDHATATSSLEVGSLGMPAGPGLVSTTFFGTGQPANVSIPITIPDAPEGVTTRADAVAAALGEPPVKETIASLPEPPGTSRAPSSTPPEPSDFTSVFLTWPIPDGWQVGYAQSTGQAFLVTITPDGTRIERAGTS